MTGERYNQGKLRWRNIPLFLLRGLVQVGQMGEAKYDTYNFLKGLPVSDTLDSLMRHLDALIDPNQSDLDSESNLNHCYHIAWNALVAAWMIENRPDLDDRWKGNDLPNFKNYKIENKKIKYINLKRKLHWTGWEFPKGGIGFLETKKNCIKREIKEEIGLKIKK